MGTKVPKGARQRSSRRQCTITDFALLETRHVQSSTSRQVPAPRTPLNSKNLKRGHFYGSDISVLVGTSVFSFWQSLRSSFGRITLVVCIVPARESNVARIRMPLNFKFSVLVVVLFAPSRLCRRTAQHHRLERSNSPDAAFNHDTLKWFYQIVCVCL
jgi:hypothetical protein